MTTNNVQSIIFDALSFLMLMKFYKNCITDKKKSKTLSASRKIVLLTRLDPRAAL